MNDENLSDLYKEAEREHRILGGSTADIWSNCPGSVFFRKNMGKIAESPAMKRGTLAHKTCEVMLEDFLEHKVSGTDPDIRAHLLIDDDELLESARSYVEAVWVHGLDQSITGKAYGFEESFVISEDLDMGGFVDFWCVYTDDRGRRVLLIVDYKNGYTEVEIEKNPQIAFYAVAARKEFRDMGKDIDLVRGVIYQPNSRNEAYKETTFSAKQLDTWEAKFLKAAETIFVEKKQKFKAGDHCEWCPAKGKCPTHMEYTMTESSLQLIDVKREPLPSPEALSPEQRSRIVLNYDYIKDFLDACKSQVLEDAKAGRETPGLKIVEGPRRRKWKNGEGGEEQIIESLKSYGLEDCTKCKLKALTVIEKELAEAVGKETAKAAITELCDFNKPSLIVVPENDKRPAAKNLLDYLDE